MRKLYNVIRGRLTAARTRAKLSQEDMGRIMGMTRAGVSQMETGKGRILIEHLYNVGSALKIRVATLLP